MPSDIDKPGRDLVLPTEALIHTAEPTTTTSTNSVAADPSRQSRKRANSQAALSALTSPPMPSNSSVRSADYGFPPPRQDQEHYTAKTDIAEYEAFPSFDSWSPRPRFSLTRSLSLRSPSASQPAAPGRGQLFRTLTCGPGSALREDQPRGLESEAERAAWMGEALSSTQVCLWAGTWRRRSSGEFICPCGEHRAGADSPWVRSLEVKMRERVRGGAPRKGE